MTRPVTAGVGDEASDRGLCRAIAAYPLLVGFGAISKSIELLGLAALGIYLLPRVEFKKKNLRLGWRGGVLVSLLIWCALLQRHQAINASAAALVGVLLILALGGSKLSREARLEAVMASLALYAIASVVAYHGLGLRSNAAGNRVGGLDSSFGIFDLRIFFPFSNSLVVPPVLASVYLCWMGGRALRRRSRSSTPKAPMFQLAGIAASAYILLAANYRVPLFMTILLLLIGRCRPNMLHVAAVPLALLVFLVPFWWNDGRNPPRVAVDTVMSTAGEVFQRDQAAGRELSSLNSRTQIWSSAESAFARANAYHQAFGFGPNGHVGSDASREYFRIAQGFASSGNSILSHSSAWQTLLDSGLAGFALLFGLIVITLAAAKRWSGATGQHVLTTPLVPLLALVASAGTEVTLAPLVGQESFFVFVLLGAVSIMGLNRDGDSPELPLATTGASAG